MGAAALTTYNAAGIISSIVVKVPLTIVIVVILVLLIRNLSQHTTAIEPISVPKMLAEGGYTPEVAAQRLRDAMTTFAEEAKIELQKSAIVTRAELPTIAVPTVGLSLDAITSTIRTFFGNTRHRSISGELIVVDKLLWLRLRKDGRTLYSSPAGIPPDKPDELLAEAAAAVWDESERELVAAWYVSKDPARAIEKANRMIERPRPGENVAGAYVIKGMALRALGDREGAAASPGRKDAEGAAARKYDDAIAAYSEAIRLDPKHAATRYNLGNALQLRQRHEDAIAAYREAIRLDPSFSESYNNLGVVLGKLGDHEGAVAAYREAIKLAPTIAKAYINAGATLQLLLGRTDEATAVYREAVKVDPMNAMAHYNLGTVLRSQPGKIEDAIAEYREAIRLDPDYVNAYFNLGMELHRQTGKSGEAIAAYREVIKRDPKFADAHYYLGLLLQDQPGKSEDAIAAYREVTKLDPNYSDAHANLGAILKGLGRTEEAIAEFRAALRSDPNNTTARENLNEILPNAPGARDSTNEEKSSARQ